MASTVSVIGGGSLGTAIAKIVGTNVQRYDFFNKNIKHWVFDEVIEGEMLSEIMQSRHENVKYLPGVKVPDIVSVVTDQVEACRDADILVIVMPSQFVHEFCTKVKGQVKGSAEAISLVKGFQMTDQLKLSSEMITEMLNIPCSVLSGANIAMDLAKDNFCEATLGCSDAIRGNKLKRLFHTDYFLINIVNDSQTVEVCGALKNVVGMAVGLLEADRSILHINNTRATVIRLGLMEIVRFTEKFYPGCQMKTFLESCGVADLLATSFGGRNRQIAEAFVKSDKTMEQLELEMLNGQKLQGPVAAEKVYTFIRSKHMEESFPLFIAVHKICVKLMPPSQLIQCIKQHPEHK